MEGASRVQDTWRQCARKTVATALACVLALSTVAVPAQRAEAETVSGPVTAWALTKLADFSVGMLEKVCVSSLGWAAGNTDNNAVDAIYKMVNYAIGDPIGTKILEECAKIEQDLEEIKTQLTQMESEINSRLSYYQTATYYTQANERYKAMYAPAQPYSDLVDRYRDYVAAATALAQAETDHAANPTNATKAAVDAARAEAQRVQGFLDNDVAAIAARGSVNDPGGFLAAIDKAAENACTVYPSRNPDDPNGRGQAQFDRDNTYVGVLNKISYENNAFEHQHYAMLKDGLNKSAIPFTTLVVAYRIYADYRAAAGNDTAAEEQYFPQAANAALNSINNVAETQCTAYDTSGLFPTVNIKTAMRPIDVEPTLPLDGYASSASHTEDINGDFFDHDYHPETTTQTFTAYAEKTTSEMPFYRVRTGGQTFLLLKDAGITQYELTRWYVRDAFPLDQYYGYPNQDFYNLLSVEGGRYRMVQAHQDYIVLVNQHSNTKATFIEFLTSQGLSDIPQYGSPSNVYVMANSWIHPQEGPPFAPNNHYSHFYLPRTDNPAGAAYEFYNFNTENYKDQGVPTDRFKLLTILTGDESKMTYGVNKSVSGKGTLEVAAEGGQGLEAVSARTQLAITAQPSNANGRLVGLKVKDAHGNVIQELLDKDTASLFTDENGVVEVGYAMPYQDVVIEASFFNVEGDGTPENPFLIPDSETLGQCMDYYNAVDDPDACFKVTADFDCRSGGHAAFKKNAFAGTFDGGGHTLSSLGVGSLFYEVGPSGVVKDLVLEDATGNFAYDNKGTVTGCSQTGNAARGGAGQEVGGIVTHNASGASVVNCFNAARVVGSKAGGIAFSNRGTIANCYNTADLHGLASYGGGNGAQAGGIAADSWNGTIENCYNVGEVRDFGTRYAIAPMYPFQDADSSYSYYSSTLDVNQSQANAKAMPYDVMKTSELVGKLNDGRHGGGWNFWTRVDGVNDGLPYFSAHDFDTDDEGVILIPDFATLQAVAQAVQGEPDAFANASYKVTADILNVTKDFPLWSLPIGTEAVPFGGTFDGGGHVIGGLRLDEASAPGGFAGLFGVVDYGAVVHDVQVCAFELSSANHVLGGLAGLNRGTIRDCSSGTAQYSGIYVDDTITIDDLRKTNAHINGGAQVGGLVGVNIGRVENCWSGADVASLAGGAAVGGLVGQLTQGSIVNSYAMGKVGHVNDASNTSATAGGLVGAAKSGTVIDNAYFCGSEVVGSLAGGVVGSNEGSVSHAYFLAESAPDAFGTGEGDAQRMPKKSMIVQSFADALNASVADGMHYWVQADDVHHGYPTLAKDPMVERTLVDPATGITLTGVVHAGAVLSVERLQPGHDLHSELGGHTKGEVLGAFDIGLAVVGRDAGAAALGGPVRLSFPLGGAYSQMHVYVLHKLADGRVVAYRDAARTDEAVAVTVEALSPFAVVAEELTLAPVGDRSVMPMVLLLGAAACALAAYALARNGRATRDE
ncbi:hypothetical protein [Raoultibacter phocaeensis]|uniref:hypothetical protein n=1 Tax=Raoultibacter phocaeensis TaxID=2479841 RepID=UPI0015D59D86|nr:hypothetical protein [Raoultibacter phocaeensis]